MHIMDNDVLVDVFKVDWIKLIHDKPVRVRTHTHRYQCILLRHNDNTYRAIEYQMAPIHYKLRKPWIKLCLLYWTYDIVKYQQDICVRVLLLLIRKLIDISIHLLLFKLVQPFSFILILLIVLYPFIFLPLSLCLCSNSIIINIPLQCLKIGVHFKATFAISEDTTDSLDLSRVREFVLLQLFTSKLVSIDFLLLLAIDIVNPLEDPVKRELASHVFLLNL